MQKESKLFLEKYIIENVFKSGKEKYIESRSGGPSLWLFDFKRVCLSGVFLKNFTQYFLGIYGLKDYQIGGLEVSSIPLLSAISLEAQNLGGNINCFFVRKSRKKDGFMNQIEGEVLPNVPIILIDDIVNSGQSIFKILKALEIKENIKIKEIFSIIQWRESVFYTKFLEMNINLQSIFLLKDFDKSLSLNLQTDIGNMKSLKDLMPETEIVWRTFSKNPNFALVVYRSEMLLFENILYFASNEGSLKALDSRTGEIIWEFKTLFGSKGKRILSTPVIFENKIFFGTYDGNFYCLDRFTGNKIWKDMSADWIGSSPCVSHNLKMVYVGMEYGLINKKGGLTAFDIDTGKAKWVDKSHREFTHSSPFALEKKNLIFCGSNDKNFRVYNSKTGELLKIFEVDGEIKMGFVAHKKLPLISFGTMSGKVYIYDYIKAEFVDIFETGEAVYSNQLFEENILYITSLDKKVYAYDFVKKQLLWSFSTSGRVFSTPTIYDKYTILGSNDGKVYFLNKYSGEIYKYLQFSERVVCKVFVNQEFIYIQTIADEVFCLKNFLN